MKNWTYLFIVGILVFAFIACDKDKDSTEKYPSLKVVNQNDESEKITISSVVLVGYEFNNLSIAKGNSQSFTLTEGMPAGYNDINVVVKYYAVGQNRSSSIKINFTNGQTSSVTLRGSISGEGSKNFYMEHSP